MRGLVVVFGLCLSLPLNAAITARGEGIVVAVIGSGVDHTSIALGRGLGPAFKVKGGYDFIDHDGNPMDHTGRGTLLAQVIASEHPGYPGIAPKASLLAYRVVDVRGTPSEEHLVGALARAVDDGAHVILIGAFGLRETPDGPVARAVDAAVARGVVVCAAAGDSIERVATINAAGAARNAITVGSVRFQRVDVSSGRGPTTVAMTFKPDIVADATSAARPGQLFAFGSDIAAARVAGMCAILRQLHPDWTPHEVKSALVTTGQPLAYQESPLARGGGMADLERAAAVDVFVSETALMFGQHPATTGTRLVTRSVTIHNRSPKAQSFVIRSESYWDVKQTVSRRRIVIDAGGSATIQLALEMDYAALPFPEDFSIGGDLVIEGETELRVPWAFMRGARATVLYDFNVTEPVTVFDLGPGNDRVFPWSPGRVEVWMKPGFYDFVKAARIFEDRQQLRIVIEENRRMSGDDVVVLREKEATIPISVHGVDERGVLLQSLRTGGLYQSYLHLNIGDAGKSYSDSFEIPFVDVLVSPVSERVTYAGGESYLDGVNGRLHSVVHRPVRGLTAPPAWTNAPGSFRRATIARSAAGNATVCFELGFTSGVSNEYPWCAASTSRSAIEFLASGESTFVYQGFSFEDSEVSSPPIIWHEGVFMTMHDWWWTPSPVTPRFPDGSTMRFGMGPVRPGVIGGRYIEWGSTEDAGMYGPLGERHHSSREMTWTMSGPTYRDDGSIAQAEYPDRDNVEPGDRYEERNVAVRASGRPAPVVVEAVEGTPAGDRLPSFSSIRVRAQSGEITDALEAGSRGFLEFSARNYLRDRETQVAMRTEATRALWRRNGTESWLPLGLHQRGLEHFDDAMKVGHQPAGAIYRAALQPALAFPGIFDLRIEIEDVTGNRVIWTQNAAFTVTIDSKRRRSAGR